MAAGWLAAATVASSLIGAAGSASAKKNGGQEINTASQNAVANQAAAMTQARQGLAPYNTAGVNALQALQTGLGVGGYGNATGGGKKTLPTGYHLNYKTSGLGVQNNGGNPYYELTDASGNVIGVGGQQELLDTYGTASPTTYDNSGSAPAGYGALVTPFDQSAQGQAIAGTGFVNGKPFDMSPEALANTPGYKFNLLQGQQAVQNSAAARGLGVSGAALKSAADYATGLADSTWQSQANNYYAGQNNYNNAANTYYAGQNNAYNKLMGVSGLGETAASTTGTLGVNSAANQATNLINGATAQAAGNVGAATSLGTGLSTGVANASNSYQQNQLLKAIQNQNAPNGIYTPASTADSQMSSSSPFLIPSNGTGTG